MMKMYIYHVLVFMFPFPSMIFIVSINSSTDIVVYFFKSLVMDSDIWYVNELCMVDMNEYPMQ